MVRVAVDWLYLKKTSQGLFIEFILFIYIYVSHTFLL